MTRSRCPFLSFIVAILCVLAFPAGCVPTPDAANLAAADARAGDIGEKVSAAAAQVAGNGQEVIATAKAGQQATPPPARPALDPYWIKLIASGQAIVLQGGDLAGIRRDVDTLRAEVQAGQRQLQDAMAALDAEREGRAKDNQAWEQKLAKANSQWERMFRTISWLAIVAIGISVAVGVLMHDFRISVGGGAGGLAVVVACMIVGQIQAWLPWVAGGVLAAVVLWIGIETWLRGSLRAALKTSPVQDVADLLSPKGPAGPVGLPGPVAPAGPVIVGTP